MAKILNQVQSLIHRLKQAPVAQETRRAYTQLVKEENEKFIPPIRPRFQSQFGGLWTDLTTAKDIVKGKLSLNLLTSEEATLLDHWIDWGYVIIPNAVPEVEIDALTKQIDLTLSGETPKKASYWDNGVKCVGDANFEIMQKPEAKLLDLHSTSDAATKVIFSSKIQRFLHLIFERPALAFQSLTFLYGSQQPVHQDTAFVLVDSPLEFAAAWVALEDIEEGSGELIYYPGSHHLEETLFEGKYKWAPPQTPELKNYSESLHQKARDANLTLQYFRPKKGDVLLWSSDLIHGGSQTKNPTLTRKSIVTHYCPFDRHPMYFYGDGRFEKIPVSGGDFISGQH